MGEGKRSASKKVVLNIELWPRLRWVWAILAGVAISTALGYARDEWSIDLEWFAGWFSAVVVFSIGGKLRF